MATERKIQIADQIIPVRSREDLATSSGVASDVGGVYPIRSRSIDGSRSRTRSRSILSGLRKSRDVEDQEPEGDSLRQEGDFKTKQV